MCTGHFSPQQLSVLEIIEAEAVRNESYFILWHPEKGSFVTLSLTF